MNTPIDDMNHVELFGGTKDGQATWESPQQALSKFPGWGIGDQLVASIDEQGVLWIENTSRNVSVVTSLPYWRRTPASRP